MVRCPNCDRAIEESDVQCPHCGAKQLTRRVTFGANREEFALTPDEPYELGDIAASEEPPVKPPRDSEIGKSAGESPRHAPGGVRWGGFFRRFFALLLDMIVVALLMMVMFLLSFIGYKVGLSGHGKPITWRNATPLFFLISWAAVFLATIYFVVFHGMEGKTIGKRLLGLRVVGPEQLPIGYGRAFLRWLVMVILAPLGLGFLWVLWSGEKRSWHDYLARTWVIRE